jgi:hypothetical protein
MIKYRTTLVNELESASLPQIREPSQNDDTVSRCEHQTKFYFSHPTTFKVRDFPHHVHFTEHVFSAHSSPELEVGLLFVSSAISCENSRDCRRWRLNG